MAVGSGVPYNAHTGNGVSTVYGYSFTLTDAADLVVTINGAPTSSYTVSGLGNPNGGAITFTTPPANGAAIFIQRVIRLVRDTEYQTNGDLQAETVNADFDRLWMAVQGSAYENSRALRLPETTAVASLPVAASRANKLLSFDSDGDPVMVAPSAGTATALALDLADASSAVKGAAMVAFSHANAYASGTVGGKLRQVVSVKDAPFSATGDGVTDDYAAIQAAIDSLDPNVGGVVEFPPGRYIVGATIAITRNNVTLRGTRGAVIKQKDNMPVPGWPPIITERGAMIGAFQKLNLSFENLTLDGNKANNDINDNYGNGINIYDCQRVTVRGCHIYGFARDGVTVSDYTRLDAAALGNEDIIITDNLITDCRAASQTTGGEGIIVVQGTRVVIANNVLARNWRGIELETLATTGLYRGCVNLTVTGNVCLDNEYGGIGVNGPSRLTLTGNICDGAAQYGIRINNISAITASEIVVSGNRIKGATVAGLTVENYEQLQVIGNHIQGCTVNLLMSGAKDLTVQNNVISGSLQHGVQFTGGTNQNIILSGNLIRASGQSAANTYDNLTGNAIYCVLSGNRIDGASARYGINAAGSSWTIIGNALDNSGATALINDTTSGGARIRDNGGYITESVGTATIASGTTSIVVNHGCSKAPGLGNITVTLGENPTNTAGDIWVSSITATQFTVNCRNNPGASNLDLGWKVQML